MIFLTFLFLIKFMDQNAWSDEFIAKVKPLYDNTIPELHWATGLTIDPRSAHGTPATYIGVVHGHFQKEGAYLIFGDLPVKSSHDGDFSLSLKINSNKTEFKIILVNQLGIVTEQNLELMFLDWKQFLAGQLIKYQAAKTWSLTPSLGMQYFSYKQDGIDAIQAWSPVAGINGDYRVFSDRWKLFLRSDFSVFPFGGSNTIRFFDASFGISYKLIPKIIRWEANLQLGVYSFLSFASNFGTHNVLDPEIGGDVRYYFSSNHRMGVFGKYSPLFSGFAILALSNAQYSTGINYAFMTKSPQWLNFSLDATWFRLILSYAQCSLQSYNFKFSYEF
jgi:hypothetical protein